MEIEKFKFTITFAVIGLIIGLLLPNGLIYFSNDNWFNISNPQETIEAVIIGFPIAIIIEFITGFILGSIGLVIDLIRNYYK